MGNMNLTHAAYGLDKSKSIFVENADNLRNLSMIAKDRQALGQNAAEFITSWYESHQRVAVIFAFGLDGVTYIALPCFADSGEFEVSLALVDNDRTLKDTVARLNEELEPENYGLFVEEKPGEWRPVVD